MTNKKWRLIINGPNSAHFNMAVDEFLMRNSEVPVLRFYQWDPPAVSIGCFQGMEEEVDIKKCEELGIDYVRRITGGGAVFHDKELTYSIIVPLKNSFIPEDLNQSYEKICMALINGLKKIGISADYVPLNDIVANSKKISGCAQTRRGGIILHHGTLLLKVDPEKMFSVLKVPDQKIKDKMIASVKERVTSISDILGREVKITDIIENLKKGFEESLGVFFSESNLTESEIKGAEKIKNDRFIKKEWNYAR